GNIYPNNVSGPILDRFIKEQSGTNVPKGIIPNYEIPTLRDDQWYFNNGYSNGGALSNDRKKIFTQGDYSFSHWDSFDDVVIVSKTGDITLS
ncbi:hypothetical protein, partial [Pseudomonas sp. 2995-3]|uniref:hypothetical protein n=1 Tax=Pseudomonas sp. 2995-3 TaxID=1712680 RepID=UPI001C487D01